MKSHGKSKAVIAAVIFEVNSLQSSRFGEALRYVKDYMDSKRQFSIDKPDCMKSEPYKSRCTRCK